VSRRGSTGTAMGGRLQRRRDLRPVAPADVVALSKWLKALPEGADVRDVAIAFRLSERAAYRLAVDALNFGRAVVRDRRLYHPRTGAEHAVTTIAPGAIASLTDGGQGAGPLLPAPHTGAEAECKGGAPAPSRSDAQRPCSEPERPGTGADVRPLSRPEGRA